MDPESVPSNTGLTLCTSATTGQSASVPNVWMRVVNDAGGDSKVFK